MGQAGLNSRYPGTFHDPPQHLCLQRAPDSTGVPSTPLSFRPPTPQEVRQECSLASRTPEEGVTASTSVQLSGRLTMGGWMLWGTDQTQCEEERTF